MLEMARYFEGLKGNVWESEASMLAEIEAHGYRVVNSDSDTFIFEDERRANRIRVHLSILSEGYARIIVCS